MRTLLVALAASVWVLGCDAQDACGDTSMQSAGVNACVAHGAPAGYCVCVGEYLYERHSCADISAGDVSLSAIIDACRACGGTQAECTP